MQHDRVAILQRALQQHNPVRCNPPLPPIQSLTPSLQELLKLRCQVASMLHEQGMLRRWALETTADITNIATNPTVAVTTTAAATALPHGEGSMATHPDHDPEFRATTPDSGQTLPGESAEVLDHSLRVQRERWEALLHSTLGYSTTRENDAAQEVDMF
jgi:hypothetical protein